MNFKIDTREWILEISNVLRELSREIFITISRAEADRFQGREITVKRVSRGGDSQRGKKRKKKKNKVYSVKSSDCFRPMRDFSVISCPSNFVQNHPMSEYVEEENLTLAESRDHKRPIHRPTVSRYKTRHYPLMKSVENVDGAHTRRAEQRGSFRPTVQIQASGSRRRSSSSKIETEDRVVPV